MGNCSGAMAGVNVVPCAAPTTREPTARLFIHAATLSAAQADVQLVDGAWDRFRSGDSAGYLTMIAAATNTAYADGADVVALAQASMADAAELVTLGPPPLTSPQSGLAAAVEAVTLAATAAEHQP
ncbi:hypothetical protein [Paraburkholderia ginsengisoli]|uniref:Uncharacterized protein n=2 Tax=Paraburkholderia ginsengisoli TaxID=311231 RepID=A0A7T4TBG8_9BURK|nr:hypothetical protein [Paraburkholderia ginsengisoli]QQC66513.1 hypothetical protein I6I06_27515 [Paraburkholderia ginsengisoli]